MSAIGKFRAKSDVYKSVYLFNLMYILYRLMIKTKNHIFVSIFFFFFKPICSCIDLSEGKHAIFWSQDNLTSSLKSFLYCFSSIWFIIIMYY